MTQTNKVSTSVIIILTLLLGWALFFHYYPVERLVNAIGVQNTYLAAFIFSVIGGFSFVTGTSLYAALVALAHGGLNPYTLGIVSGLGIFLSDSLFYFVAVKMRSIITSVTSTWENIISRMWQFLDTMPKSIVFLGVLCYSAFAPIPNDILLAVLALSGYQYRQFAVFLLAGDMIMAFLLTIFGAKI